MTQQNSEEPSGQLVEHFFRHESANLIAVLSRAFGLRRMDLVEDMVQAAMLEAMHAWKHKGVPQNPAGWIHRVARNRILDALRREQVHDRAMALAGHSMESSESLLDEWLEESRLPDSLLRMMFVCCHPSLDRPSQIALTLKILGGFGNREIARALLTNVEAIKKRTQRAKKKLAEQQLALEIPSDEDLSERLATVHDVLYLMFNEGYSTSHGADPIRDDLCEEAARLCHMLCEHQLGDQKTYALLALMLFHAARLDSRVDESGVVVLLEDQDRSTWDQKLIRVGEHWIERSGQPTSRFHLEAGIALLHCRGKSVIETDWKSIVHLYERLTALAPSPLYLLNQAIARAQAGDIDAAKQALADLQNEQHSELANYYLLDCAMARVHELEGNKSEAIDCLLRAMTRSVAEHEKTLIERKISKLAETK